MHNFFVAVAIKLAKLGHDFKRLWCTLTKDEFSLGQA